MEKVKSALLMLCLVCFLALSAVGCVQTGSDTMGGSSMDKQMDNMHDDSMDKNMDKASPETMDKEKMGGSMEKNMPHEMK